MMVMIMVIFDHHPRGRERQHQEAKVAEHQQELPSERRPSFRKQLRFPWSPKLLPAFRRKRTCFEKSTSFGFLNVLREASPLAASFGSTHVLREAGEGTPFPAFRRKRTCFEKSASFGFLRLPSASFGFLRLPSASFGFLRLPSASFGFLRLPSASFGKLHLWRASFTSFGKRG